MSKFKKECRAAVWACKTFSTYLYSLDTFTLQSDHKPLIPLINCKDLNSYAQEMSETAASNDAL